ncbi:hypothetical protein E3T26_10200 [Cryobacterium sp. TMT1-21]|uniref:Uncharacterized protein n=1 Tax=Cryobacterium shii TaxID=1259235 RepID=A0AAQ2HEK7_9MICO|nr:MULTISPECIES: hypothetical protein [Cryobacterium]TFC42489.1 hypothetical protein E3O49_14150 [Cryobacterium shii]TFC80821.1 hypothetical protein E3T24_15695 [Cryobacterium sp. TmT2-59]TFD13251.1 hypothetical protein E3T26_10200 [Cryobacterium sp. TMT1-21]TFD18672.1 hypothetical protein E3T42_05490 [Cryobacterium sp. TMT4-10]TFD28474.1 hypothetical protein E3T32_01015 [Cryobacterium sp. TMT2-23]
MTDAPPDLPERHTVLRSFAGHLEAGPDVVFRRLAAALAPRGEAGGTLYTDAERRLIVLRRGWWYRGEYQVRPEDETGSLVQYEIVNVAQPLPWAATWAAASVLRAAPRAFQALLTGLSRS